MIFNFALNNVLTYRDRRLRGWAWFKGLFGFMIACSVGALANVGIATYLFENRTQWVLSGLAGAVWNYAVSQVYTWVNAGRSAMLQRWLGTVLLDGEQQFRRVKGCAGIAQVIATIEAEHAESQSTPTKKAA